MELMMVMDDGSQTTVSGRLPMQTICCGKAYEWLRRSAVTCWDAGIRSTRKLWMHPCMASCLSLYRHFSSAYRQAFNTWVRVCCCPHRLHETDGIFFHRWRLELWGKVSVREFRAKLRTRSGRLVMVVDHR